MQPITFTIPYPPSHNRMYLSVNVFSAKQKRHVPRRFLTKEARSFKKYVSELIFYSFPRIKYGNHPVSVNIVVNPPLDNRKRDHANGEKALFDAIAASGIIDDDDQIVDRSSTIGPKIGRGQWIVTIKPFKQEITDESGEEINSHCLFDDMSN